MNSTESLTRTLPDEPTRFLTPKAVEMPFGVFAAQFITLHTAAQGGFYMEKISFLYRLRRCGTMCCVLAGNPSPVINKGRGCVGRGSNRAPPCLVEPCGYVVGLIHFFLSHDKARLF